MALVVKDRVKETTATTGTGTLTLAGAVTGFQSFSSALSNGDTTYYSIFESSTGEWEVGLGTFTLSGTTLSRDTILESSNAGSAINLTAGAADVFITYPAEKSVYLDASGDVTSAAGQIDISNFNNDSGYTTNTGTVTSVGGTGTVNGISLSGTVTSSGNLTLGGTFSATVSEISDLTATAAELNILDGVTASTAELNYNDITTLGTSQASKVVTADANGNIKLLEEVQAVCYLETVIALSGTTPTVDCDEGNTFTLSTSGNTTFTFSYAGVQLTTDDAYAFTLRVTAGGTHTLTWPASVDWAGGTAPDAPASGETDVFVFLTTDGGTNWYGFRAGDAMA